MVLKALIFLCHSIKLNCFILKYFDLHFRDSTRRQQLSSWGRWLNTPHSWPSQWWTVGLWTLWWFVWRSLIPGSRNRLPGRWDTLPGIMLVSSLMTMLIRSLYAKKLHINIHSRPRYLVLTLLYEDWQRIINDFLKQKSWSEYINCMFKFCACYS